MAEAVKVSGDGGGGSGATPATTGVGDVAQDLPFRFEACVEGVVLRGDATGVALVNAGADAPSQVGELGVCLAVHQARAHPHRC